MLTTNIHTWRNADKYNTEVARQRHRLFHADLDENDNPRFKRKTLFQQGMAIYDGQAQDYARVKTDVKRNTKKAYVCMTFDGGYGDWIDVYRELFEEYGVRCTFFIQTAQIGGGTYGSGAYRYCDWDDIRTLYNDGHEIACHTVNHPDFCQMYESDIDANIMQSHSLNANQFVPKGTDRMYAFMIHPKPVYARNSQYSTEDYRRLKTIKVWLRHGTGTLSGDMHAEVWSVSGGQPNAQVGTDSVAVDSATIGTNDYTEITFTFDTAIPDANIVYPNSYFVVIDLNSVSGTSSLYIASSDLQRIGEVGRSTDGGSSWTMTDYDTAHSPPYYVIGAVSSTEAEMRDAKAEIEDEMRVIDSDYRCTGFAYTFSDISHSSETVQMASRYFDYARDALPTKQFDINTNYPPDIDLYDLKSHSLHGWCSPADDTGQREFIRMGLAQLKARGGVWMLYGHATYTPGPTEELSGEKLERLFDEVNNDDDVDFITMREAVQILRDQSFDRRPVKVVQRAAELPVFSTHFCEPAAALASTVYAKNHWTAVLTGGATAATVAVSGAVMRLTTGATTGENATLLYTDDHFNTDDGIIMEARVRFNTVITSMNAAIGLNISGGADYAEFLINSGSYGDDLYIGTNYNTTVATPTTTNMEFAADTWYVFRIDLTNIRRPRFYINGFEVTELHLGVVRANVALKPYFYIHPTTDNARVMDIDYVHVWQKHVPLIDAIA